MDRCEIKCVDEFLTKKAKNSLPKVQDILAISNFYKILGDPTRVKILWILMENRLCVCEICEVLNMNQSAISHQLKLLRLANLVKNEREGKVIYYSLSDNHVKDIFEITNIHLKEEIR